MQRARGGGCAGPRRAGASTSASRGRQRRQRTWAGAAALAAAAVAVGLAVALPPGESGRDLLLLPDYQGAPHAGWPGGAPYLLPEAHADHTGPVRCDSFVRTHFTSHPTTIRFVSPDGTYGIGDPIDIRIAPADSARRINLISFSGLEQPRHWIGDTILEMEAGRPDRNAIFAGPSLSPDQITHVVYRFTVQEGDYSADLDYKQTTSLYWRTPVVTGGGGISYLSDHPDGDPFDCILPTPGTAGSLSYQSDIIVDGIRPNVTSVSAAVPDGTYGPGREISVNVTFGEPVFFDGSAEPPSLALDLGWTDRKAAYAGGNGTATLVFNYTLRAGDHAARLAYNATNALAAAGLEDIAGNAANLTLFAPGAPGSLSNSSRLEADTPPGVESVSSPNAAKVYGIGETIRVNVTFTRPVAIDTAGGSPALGIEAGGPGRSAAYVPGSASGRSLLFEYAVGPGDSGRPSASSLSLNGATIEGPDGRAAGTALPGPAGAAGGAPLYSSSGGPILVDHAKPALIPMGTVRAAGASSVVALEANGTRYVLAGGSSAVNLTRVHENGTLAPADSLEDGGDVTLRQIDGVDAFRMGNETWAVAAARNDNAIQTIRVHDNGTLEGVDSLSAGTQLSAPWDVKAFEMGAENHTYALAVSSNPANVQLARVHPNGTLEPAGNLHSTVSNFVYPIRSDVFRTENGSVRALVTAYSSERVHLFRVNETGLAYLATAADDSQGGDFPVLAGPAPVVSFDLGGERHALVGSYSRGDEGLQLIRIADGGDSVEEAGSARDDTRGFDALDNARSIAVFSAGSATYVAAIARDEDGIQLVRMRAGGGDGALVPAGSAKDVTRDPGSPFASLVYPHSIDAFELGGRTYAAVAAQTSGVVHLVRLSPASVVSVSSPNATGPHAAGAWINVTVNFDEPVVIGTAPPLLLLSAGGTPGNATYLSGNATSSLAFNYTVRAGDNGVLGYRAVDSLSGYVRDLGGPRADTTLPAPGSSGSLSDSAVGLDTRPPLVLSVSSNASGTYGIGGTIHASVQFGERVEVDDEGGLPVLALRVGSAARAASYSSGSGTDTLLFAYDVREGDASASLDYANRSALVLNGSSIRDAAGNDADLRLAEPGGSILGAGAAIAVDGVRPEASSASSPDAPGLYGIGRTISVDVNFTTPVTVAGGGGGGGGGGQPFVALGANLSAPYAGGSGTERLRFEYAVGEGDSAPRLDYANRSALVLNGSSIRDGAGNDARTTLPEPSGSLAAGGSIEVDGVRPEAESVWSPNRTATTYYTNQRVHVNVNFSEAVTVGAGATPPPSIALNAGDGARAAYHTGSGTGTLAFVYDVRPDDSAAALDYADGSELDLGGASIRDAAGNDANTALPAPGPQGSPLAAARIAVDGTVVSVASVTSPDADGAYGAGSRVNITVTFTEAVDVSAGATPPPSIALNAGEGARAAYDSGGGTAALLFAYEVRPGDNAEQLAYAGGSALSPGGAAIAATDGGAPAHLDLPAPGRDASLSGSKAIAIDTAPPAVERVFSPNRTDTYRIGAAIHVVAEFDEAVSVAGEPRIPLDAGGGEGAPATAATYESGSGTASLLFLYTVAAGDFSADLDYAPGSSIVLPDGASIRDAAGNDANTTLPAPGGGSSLGDTSAISVRGTSEPLDASASAVFAGPNTVRIDYDAPLGPSPAHEGPAYGAVTAAGGPGAPAVSESGLGTRTHTVVFGGDGVDAGQSGTIRLLANLEGEVDGIVPYAFPAGAIPVRPGEEARTLSPPGASPAAAIEADGFVRALNATAAGDSARPAINLTGLAAPPGGAGAGSGPVNATLPADGRVAIIASFAEVSFPPGVEARGVPADGLIELYVAARAPTAQEIADGLGVDTADVLEVRRAVEVGDDAARIEFSLPVRILLVGQADGRAFYVGAAAGGAAAAAAVSPIRAECEADDTGTVHAQLGRSGACWIESGGDMVIYTYHMTRFGTARLAEFADAASMCAAVLSPPVVALGAVEAGGRSDAAAASQTVTRTGSVPLAAVSVGASAWTGADGAEVMMPANATSVAPGGAASGGVWTPLGGAPVSLPVDAAGRSATAEFRVDVPQDALPAGASSSPAKASQTVTYTVSCARPSG